MNNPKDEEMEIASILEMFGVNGSSSLHIGENGAEKNPISVVLNSSSSVTISSAEARYLSKRFVYLAEKVDARKARRDAMAAVR